MDEEPLKAQRGGWERAGQPAREALTLPRIGIRADALPGGGGGHVMRCLALASELERQGAQCVVIGVRGSEMVAPALSRSGQPFLPLDAIDAPIGPALARAELGSLDALVVDSYQLDARHERAFRDRAGVLMVIDDLADRSHHCDILLDSTWGRGPGAYSETAPGATLLLGADFALLRAAFPAARKTVLERRRRGGPPRRLLVTFGLSDPHGLTAPVAEFLASRFPYLLDVVVPRSAPSWRALADLAERDPRVSLHDDPPEMADLIARADIVVGAGGGTCWERCCLGAPGVVFILADNQSDNAAALGGAGAAITINDLEDWFNPLALAVEDLADPHRRIGMVDRAAALCDGQGARRAAEALLDQIYQYRSRAADTAR